MRNYLNKLTVKLLVAIAISFFATFIIFVNFSRLFIYLIGTDYFLNLEDHQLYFWSYVMILLTIIVFIIIFLLLIRKRLKYLKYISENINHMASGQLGLSVRVEGKDELAQLAQNFNMMSKELENKFLHERQLEIEKNELITNISHDLRTPLTSVIGYLDLIRNKTTHPSVPLDEYLEIIYNKSQRLKSLIDELFEFSRLSSPNVELNFTEIDLPSLLEQVVGEYVPIFEKEKLTIQKNIPNEDIPVSIDVEKMVRVYDNLFMNAIKYSVKPSELHLSLEMKEEKVFLRISNKIDDLPTTDLNKLFDRFFMGDQSRKDIQGSGLGLSICKRIMELHRGTIHAEYKDDYITFIVEQPINSSVLNKKRLS